MENTEDMQQLHTQLREEQDKYVIAITSETDRNEIKRIRERIVALQKQIEALSSRGYSGL